MEDSRGESRRSYVALDVLRALAAFAVMIGHVRGLRFASWEQVPHTAATAAMYAATSLGHQAVMVFFVLSGFLVGGSVVASWRCGTWSWRRYVARRMARLYVVLIPALLLGLFWDRLGMVLFGASGVYDRTSADGLIISYSIQQRLGLSTFAGNFLFLQTISTKPFGSNGALWSLANEWWYYVLFPLIVFGVARRTGALRRVIFALVAAIVLRFVGGDITRYFGIWLIGVVVAELPRVRIGNRALRVTTTLVATIAFIVALSLARFVPLNFFLNDVSVAAAFAALLYLLVSATPPTSKPAPFWTALAGFSYTLYLVHLPLLTFLNAAILSAHGSHWQPTPSRGLFAAAIAALVVVYAWMISRFTEARTDRFRVRIVEPLLDLFARPITPARAPTLPR